MSQVPGSLFRNVILSACLRPVLLAAPEAIKWLIFVTLRGHIDPDNAAPWSSYKFLTCFFSGAKQ